MAAENEITKTEPFYFFKNSSFAETVLIKAVTQRSLIIVANSRGMEVFDKAPNTNV
jgi:hypothetical protein